jgi:hypothetical protein
MSYFVNRESGIGNRESRIENRESGIENRESGIGNRESGIGNRESGIVSSKIIRDIWPAWRMANQMDLKQKNYRRL